MIFYCTPACQRDHWKKKGHKQACRVIGQVEIGDDMQLPVTLPDGTTHLKLVHVMSSLGGGQWQVRGYGLEDVSIVNGADLWRLRPPSTL
jgi:MYND finger